MPKGRPLVGLTTLERRLRKRAQIRAWAEANPDRMAEYRRRYRERNYVGKSCPRPQARVVDEMTAMMPPHVPHRRRSLLRWLA